MASYITDFSPLDFQPPLALVDLDYDEVFEAELESYLSGRTKELSDKHPASYSHELNMMVRKIKDLLSRMALSGASPDRLREEAEKWLKSLEASSKSLSISHDAFRNSSNHLKQFLRQFDAKLTHSSPDFSQLLPPSDLGQPLTARQLMAQDPMWAYRQTDIEAQMTKSSKWFVQEIQSGVQGFCNSKTGKPLCQQVAHLGGKISDFVFGRNDISSPASLGRYRKFGGIEENPSFVRKSEVPEHNDVYFHATSLENAMGILRSKAIKRLDKGIYQGVFVSSKPETAWGDVVFVFNRNIERKNRVLNAEYKDARGSHFVGFEKEIPVNGETLAYIAVKSIHASKLPLAKIAEIFSTIAGREIPVVPLEPIEKTAKERAIQEGIFVPEEWPVDMNSPTEENLGL